MLEVILVFILIAILSVFAVMLFSDAGAPVRAEADALRATLRYAQARAMSDVSLWGVRVGAGSYQVIQRDQAGSVTTHGAPGEGGPHAFDASVSASGGGDFWFDYRGRPVGSTGAAAAGVQRVTLTGRDSASETVTITPGTGFVP